MSEDQNIMQPRIMEIPEKCLVGVKIRSEASFMKTRKMWQGFRLGAGEIANRTSEDFFSVSIYDKGFDMARHTPETIYEKWAAVEVSDFRDIPESMETLTLSGGLYSVFIHRGPVSAWQKTAAYIFGSWLPESDYLLDGREHFEILGEKYHPMREDSEEEVYVPIKKKS